MAERMKRVIKSHQTGFSLFEMLLVISISFVLTAIAVPEYLAAVKYLRITGDLRDLNGITAQAKMRAASNFTHARVYADLTDNTYQLQVWNKIGGAGGTGCWVADVDSTNTCISFSGAPAPSGLGNLQFAQGDTFGFGNLTTGPTPGQPTPSQAAGCYPGAANTPDGGSQLANTACIEFNSRGIPVDNNGSPLATGALYLTNGSAVMGVTASATGSIQTWQCTVGTTTWAAQ
jgi:Tfp pilus assembly major pilin PilA